MELNTPNPKTTHNKLYVKTGIQSNSGYGKNKYSGSA
jgi:hypothetical protein